jgi:hypothetical protein
VRLEELGKLKKQKKCNDLIGTRTRALPARSIVPPPIMLPRALTFFKNQNKKFHRRENPKCHSALKLLLSNTDTKIK